MADGSITYQTAEVEVPAWLLKEFGPAGLDGTWGGMSLADMEHDFSWKFAPVEEDDLDPEDFAPSESELRVTERTY